MHVLNLTNILIETGVGFQIALHGIEAAQVIFSESIATRSEKEQIAAWQMFHEMASRLDRFGNRRPVPPTNTPWRPWTHGPEANAA